MAAGDTVFGDHEQLIAKVPKLLESTEKAIASAAVHPMILAARFHGFYEYLHRMIRTEATDEHLVRFFFKMAMRRMEDELKQKAANTKRFTTFVF